MNNDRNTEAFLRDVSDLILTNISELTQRKTFAEENELDYIEGKLMAYREIYNLVKASAAEHGLPFPGKQ